MPAPAWDMLTLVVVHLEVVDLVLVLVISMVSRSELCEMSATTLSLWSSSPDSTYSKVGQSDALFGPGQEFVPFNDAVVVVVVERKDIPGNLFSPLRVKVFQGFVLQAVHPSHVDGRPCIVAVEVVQGEESAGVEVVEVVFLFDESAQARCSRP